MERLPAIMLSLLLLLSILPNTAIATDEGSMANFKREFTYNNGQFTDVAPNSVFADNIKLAYECGIMKGKSETYFGQNDVLTNEQALYIACRLHSTYLYGRDIVPDTYSGTTTEKYCRYMLDHNLYFDAYPFSNQGKQPCPRYLFAVMLAAAFPASELPEINTVVFNSIPDLGDIGSEWRQDEIKQIYVLYRAGVLTGKDQQGTFGGNDSITRGAACAIATRMIDPSLRQSICLDEELPSNAVYYTDALVTIPGTFNTGKFDPGKYIEVAVAASSFYAKYPSMIKTDDSLVMIYFSEDGENLIVSGSVLACNAFGVYSSMHYVVEFQNWSQYQYQVLAVF